MVDAVKDKFVPIEWGIKVRTTILLHHVVARTDGSLQIELPACFPRIGVRDRLVCVGYERGYLPGFEVKLPLW